MKRYQNSVITLFLVFAVVCGPKSQNDFFVPDVDRYHLPRSEAEMSAIVDSGEAQPVVVTAAKSNPAAAGIHFKQGAMTSFAAAVPVGHKNTTAVSGKRLCYNDRKVAIPMKLRL